MGLEGPPPAPKAAMVSEDACAEAAGGVPRPIPDCGPSSLLARPGSKTAGEEDVPGFGTYLWGTEGTPGDGTRGWGVAQGREWPGDGRCVLKALQREVGLQGLGWGKRERPGFAGSASQHTSVSLHLCSLDVYTDPGPGAHPRPAGLPGAE